MSRTHEMPEPGDKRLMFTVTTGRSGTRYLAFVLSLFTAVRARHEPKPRFSSCFRAVRCVPEVARQFWTDHKLAAIHAHKRPIYAETSHLACKGFLESLIELGFSPELLHLRRDPRAVALSLWKLDSIPGRSLTGVRYYLSPSEPNVLPIPDFAHKHPSDYQLCYWYCLEIAERARVYAREFAGRGVRVHTIELDSIQDVAGIRELGQRLDLGAFDPFARLRMLTFAASRRNPKSELKRPEALPAERLEAWEAEVRAWVRQPS